MKSDIEIKSKTQSFGKNYSFARKGFTMVELLVVVGIIAVMSVSAVVGFGYIGDILRARETTGFLADIIKQEELKILRQDFEKSEISFLKDYVAIDEWKSDYDLNLYLKKNENCPEGYSFEYGNDGNLIKKNSNGNIIDIKRVKKDAVDCVEFKNSEETEWICQITENSKYSNVLRLTHFNIRRDNLSNPIYISEGEGSKIKIMSPYGKKLVYSSDGVLMDDPSKDGYSVRITVTDENGKSSDSLSLQ